MSRRVSGVVMTLTAAAVVGPLILGTGPSVAAAPAQSAYSATTGVGVHNAYLEEKYPYFADALDSGAGMLELDVWTNVFGSSWRVSHENPLGNDNNCENATTPAELRTKAVDQDLGGCLTDIRTWHNAHPGHRPIMLKMELKDGFQADDGRGPAELDALLTSKLGDALFRPADLAAGHATLDAAVQAGGWPVRDELAGKFIVELIPGTVEEDNPLDPLWTDEEYATHLRDLAGAGRLNTAAAFPAVHGAEAGDPRTSRYDASIRPWFVVFDGDASAYASGSIDTSWYNDRGYLVVMTDAHKVPPAIDGTAPTPQQALDRVALLAGDNASIVSADWYALSNVLATVVDRG